MRAVLAIVLSVAGRGPACCGFLKAKLTVGKLSIIGRTDPAPTSPPDAADELPTAAAPAGLPPVAELPDDTLLAELPSSRDGGPETGAGRMGPFTSLW